MLLVMVLYHNNLNLRQICIGSWGITMTDLTLSFWEDYGII